MLFTDDPWLTTIRLQIGRLKISVEQPKIAYVFCPRALEPVFLKTKRRHNPLPHKQNILRFAPNPKCLSLRPRQIGRRRFTRVSMAADGSYEIRFHGRSVFSGNHVSSVRNAAKPFYKRLHSNVCANHPLIQVACDHREFPGVESQVFETQTRVEISRR